MPLRDHPPLEWSLEVAYDALLHELRTPLALANVALEVVASGADEGQAVGMIMAARLGVMDAQRVVRWFSQLRARGVESNRLTIEVSSVRTVIDQACALVPSAHVDVTVATDLPHVAVDRFWLAHALANVFDNAAKYTDPTERLRVVATRDTVDRVLISAIDRGPGIPPDQQDSVVGHYGRDRRRDDLTSQGLGLRLAHSFVVSMGGDFWLESDGHTGTTVSLTLPIAEGADEVEEG